MLTTIGAKIKSAKGTKNPLMSIKPQTTSRVLTNGKRYPIPNKAPINFCEASFGGGIGIKFRKKFNPKTKKIRPKIRRATTLIFFCIELILSNHLFLSVCSNSCGQAIKMSQYLIHFKAASLKYFSELHPNSGRSHN